MNSDEVRILFDLSKSNLDRVNVWFTWMLGISALVMTVIAILLALIAVLTWRHVKQAQEASKMLDEANKRRKLFDEAGNFLAQSATKKKSKLQKEFRGLSADEVRKRAISHRGFGPILFQTEGADAVYAVDDYGFLHWIPNPPTLMRMGYSWADVKQLPKAEIDQMKRGENVPVLSE